MELGLYFAVFNHLELEDALEKAAQLGYTRIELSTHTGGRFDVAEMLKADHWKRVDAAVRKCGLKISAINMSSDGQLVLGPHNIDTDVIFNGTADEKVGYGIHRMLLSAELANRMEVEVVTGFTGCEDYSRWFPWPDPDAWERMEPVFVDRWSPILARFEELNVQFAMECHPRQIVYNTETALRSVELLGAYKSWRFNLDPANLMLAGVDPVIFAAELGPRIVNVHAKDGELVAHNIARSGLLANGAWDRPGRGFRFRIAGWGDIQWRRLITELAIQGYRGPLTVEHEDATIGPLEGVEKAAQFLAPLLIKEPFPGRWW